MKGILHIVVALHCEAISIIQFFSLKKISDQSLEFAVYVNKYKNIYLIISGVGKTKIAAATTFLYCLTGRKKYSCFLNIGISGSVEFVLGDAILIHKITEVSTHWRGYPFANHLHYPYLGELMTVSQPESNYPEKGLVDMEGAAFFQMASRFVTQEHIQLLKIVSDNAAYSFDLLDKKSVEMLIQKNIQSIEKLVNVLLALSEKSYPYYQPPREFEKFQKNWKLSYTQQIQLKEYLRRWQIQKETQSAFEFCRHTVFAKQMIQQLIDELDHYANCVY